MVAWISVLVEAIGIASLLALLHIYAKNYVKMRTKFTLSLISFATLLLLERLLAVYFYLTTDMCRAIELAETVRPLLSGIEAMGLAILLIITWK